MDETVRRVRECIAELAKKFEARPLLYFSESDLQAELFGLLLDPFGKGEPMLNVFVWGTNETKPARESISRRLHSELLLPEGRVDLAVLDLAHVRFAMNSRGRFGYVQLEEGNHVFIEMKASRTNRSQIRSKNRWINLIVLDIKKLNRYAWPCFLLCFDFNKLLGDSAVSSLKRRANPNVRLMYLRDKIGDNYLAGAL